MNKVEIPPSASRPVPLSFEVEGLSVLLGANAAGKTQFLRQIHGMGNMPVLWNNQPAQETKNARGFVAQDPVFLSGNVRRNLIIAARFYGLSHKDIEKNIDRITERYGVAHLLDRDTRALSGGEQARIAMLRARIHEPDILLLDEVTAHLDPESTKRVESDMREFASHSGRGMIFVTHSLMQARRLADQILFMDHGEMIYMGAADGFWESNDPRVQRFVEAGL